MGPICILRSPTLESKANAPQGWGRLLKSKSHYQNLRSSHAACNLWKDMVHKFEVRKLKTPTNSAPSRQTLVLDEVVVLVGNPLSSPTRHLRVNA